MAAAPGRASETTARRAALSATLAGTILRRARAEDVPECGRIWREAINDYLRPRSLPEVPDELAPIGRLHGHTHATDPERFVVASVPSPAPGGERIVGFGSAVVRGGEAVVRGGGTVVRPDGAAADDGDRAGGLWFLSMLFVRPEVQRHGLGRALLERLLPLGGFAGSRATTVDTLQPISTALYAGYGIVPRLPILGMAGEIRDRAAFPPLPSGVRPVPMESIADEEADRVGHAKLARIVDGLDRELLGAAHPEDHLFLRLEDRRGFVYRGPDGAPLGYGYAGEVGRIGPIAVRDVALLEPIVGDLVRAVPARGATAIWVAGSADRLLPTLLRAGLRIDGYPLVLCWDRPFGDFSRYVPISPGLL